MTDNVVRREVQRRDDPFGIPACFYWTVDEVADWVDSIGYGKYKENFRSHFINGRKLLTVDACVLPRMGITHFGDILGLCKHIREVLGIQRHLSDYNPWQPRARYIQTQITSGRKNPQFSFREHANNLDKIIEARLGYFRKRNIYYSGWTMEKGWDTQIREQEKVLREKLKKKGKLAKGDNRKLIGSSMQDRLKAAADLYLSYEEEPRVWLPTMSATKKIIARAARPKLKKPPTTNEMGTRHFGHINWSPVRNIPYVSESGTEKPIAKKKKEENNTTPVVKVIGSSSRDVSITKAVNGNNGVIAKTEPNVHSPRGEASSQKSTKIGKEVENTETNTSSANQDGTVCVPKKKETKKNAEKKKVRLRDDSISAKSGGKSSGSSRSRSRSADSKGKEKKRSGKRSKSATTEPPTSKVEKRSVDIKKNIQPYHVVAVFHWKQMETSTGYPPLRLDKLKKCGYYYGEAIL